MKIDGKSVTPINTLKSVNKTNKTEETQSSAEHGDSVKLKNASNFALNNSGIEQQLRKSNDNITQLLTRQKSIEDSVESIDTYKRAIDSAGEKREALAEATQRLAEVLKNPPFANNDTAEKLSLVLSAGDKASAQAVDAAKSSLDDELNLVGADLNHAVSNVDRKASDSGKLISEFEAHVKDNPQALAHAYSHVEASTAHGLLGSDG